MSDELIKYIATYLEEELSRVSMSTRVTINDIDMIIHDALDAYKGGAR